MVVDKTERTVNFRRQSVYVALFVALLGASESLGATPLRQAASQVEQGIARHDAGDFAGAEQAFAEAAKSLPDDPRVLYDRACALAAQGKHDEAEPLFRQSRLSSDASVVAASQYNLGCLAAARAKARLGEHPEDAPQEVRREVIELVSQAVSYFRDCLHTAPEHDRARYNLEVLRLWTKHMADVWRQRDREKRRQSMGLLEFLEMLESEQEQLRRWTLALNTEDDSPRRRQAATQTGQSQRELAEEIGPLQEKIRALGQPDSASASPPAAAGATAAMDAQRTQAVEALTALAQDAKSAMSRAAIQLGTNALPTAAVEQKTALDHLNKVYEAIAPLEHILPKAIAAEEALIAVTEAQIGDEPPDVGTAPASLDEKEPVWKQGRVADWAGLVKPKAEHRLAELEKQTATAGAPDQTGTQGPAPPKPAAEDPLQTQAGLQKAIELGPLAQAAAAAAVSHLEKPDWRSALPQQQEALQRLREILQSLPPPPKPPPPEKKPPEKKPPEKKPSDQPPKDEKSGGGEQQPKPAEKDPPQDKDKQDESPQQKPTPDQSQPEPSRQEAEAILRQARERERDYKEQQKKLRAVIRGTIKVDKDW
jgi:tetratricopeptide (TPR) repeat protein